MTIDAHHATAVLDPTGTALDVKSMRIAMDEGWAPYVQVDLTCAVPGDFERSALDLRDSPRRLTLTVQQDFGTVWRLADLGVASCAGMTAKLAGRPLGYVTNLYFRPWNGSTVRPSRRRTFALIVTDRVFDDNEGTVAITAQSSEALLNGDALIDTVPWSPSSTSLRTICALVLARYGAFLADGTTDAQVAQVNSTTWKPGVKAWDYLNPMLEAASLRLWCDEAGVWQLTERQSTTPGAITITTTGTMVNHRDRMSLNADVWFDAVVVHYTWTDSFGLTNEAYDVAGAQPAKSVLTIERQAVYPGPGAAAGILRRGQGRGRVLDVRAVANYEATPGIAATIFPPHSDAQTGYVSAVTFELPAAEMDITTRGLTDTPDTSWLFVPAGVSWLDVPPGVSWLNYQPIGA
jgi:hypothetical protein